MASSDRLIFPKWANLLLPALAVGAVAVPVYLVALIGYGASPRTINVGYQPDQPVPFSHAQHAGQLAIDCRYCHTTVEKAPFAAIPPVATCMNCHATIQKNSMKLITLRESYQTGRPLAWVKVHDLPDYVYFDHAAHVTRGVGCVSCHDRVDRMETVYQARDLSMGWCLDCHRRPQQAIVPRQRVTDLAWTIWQADPAEQQEIRQIQKSLKSARQLTDCSTCHR